jgi:CubicO group peptidase (beta-lactamase class C family)
MNLPRSTPEAQGISSTAISNFLESTKQEKLELHSFMLVRHGHVVAEGWWKPYNADRIHLLYSLSKSFTSTAIGLAINEAKLSLQDKVISFFPNDLPETISDHLSEMTVHHLLSMATGHTLDTTQRMMEGGDNWAKNFLAIPPEQAPGSIFNYNSGATYMLAAILHNLTGVSLLEYLHPRLLEPLGIDQTYWQEDPKGIQIGFSGLHVITESIAKFGQLYVQKGLWQNQQLIPESWVDTATQKHISCLAPGGESNPDWEQGYGYQFWRCQHNCYRGDGAFGQYAVVMPDQDAVVAITSAVENMQTVLDLIWKHLLPAMNKPLAKNQIEQDKLSSTLANLSIPPVSGHATSRLANSLSGKTFHFASHRSNNEGRMSLPSWEKPIESLGLNFQKEQCTLMIKDEKEHHITCAYHQWLSGTTSLYSQPSSKVEVSGGWLNAKTFSMKIIFIETPHCLTMTFEFEGDKLTVKRRWNVSFGELELPVLVGQIR